ncbi:MAG: carbohydrate kinase family protein [Puniceicoccales bacterium]|nr:carbohydrate kinase family protein [Puniceicoccales bacterium]
MSGEKTFSSITRADGLDSSFEKYTRSDGREKMRKEDGIKLVETLEERRRFSIFAGFDAAVDGIYALLAEQTESGTVRMGTIADFAGHVAAAAGKSTNVGRRLLEVRAGGNSVLCAGALQRLGASVTVVANVGRPMHRVFRGLRSGGAEVHSTGEPNGTDALEFSDGKILLTDSSPLERLTYDAIVDSLPGGQSPVDLMVAQDAVVLTNWTMMPGGTAIYRRLLGEAAALPGSAPFFFDISDPARRSTREIFELLDLISDFSSCCRVFLSLNRKEMERVAGPIDSSGTVEERKEIMGKLHRRWPLEWILHCPDGADSFGRDGWHRAEGFFTPQPLTSTGGGDHFNGGFLHGVLCGLPRELALLLGNAVSGAYVRLGHSPTGAEVGQFLLEMA